MIVLLFCYYVAVNKSVLKFVTDLGPLVIFFYFYYNNDKNLIVNFDFKKFSNNRNIKSFYVLANDKKLFICL